jgi:hypothetical protein
MSSAAFFSVLPAVFVSLASLWMYLNPSAVPIESIDARSLIGKLLAGVFYLSASVGIGLGVSALFRKDAPKGPALFALAMGSLLLLLDQLLTF